MQRIELTIKALSPLAIGKQKHGGSIHEVEHYIPGSVIRGAIANQILQFQNSHSPNADFTQNGGDFASLFLGDRSAIFQNAYPAVAKTSSTAHEAVTGPTLILPATAVSSKADPGFKVERSDEPKGGVFDTLIDRWCADLYNHPYDPSCPKDGDRVEPFGGFYTQQKDRYCTCTATSRFLTRVGINRRRATAEDDILYSLEVLNESFLQDSKDKLKQWEPMIYRSTVLIADQPLAERFKMFINRVHDSLIARHPTPLFRLGGATSRGLGKVDIEAKDGKIVESLTSRVDRFNDKLQNRIQRWSSLFGQAKEASVSNRTYFTLDLQSEAILTENWQRTTVISESLLQKFTGLQDPSLKLEVAYSSYDYASGWNSAWGLMKDVELITNRGAVYLFSVIQDRKAEWIEALQKLEEIGVGDRTCEGFGQVHICNEFHTVFREDAK